MGVGPQLTVWGVRISKIPCTSFDFVHTISHRTFNFFFGTVTSALSDVNVRCSWKRLPATRLSGRSAVHCRPGSVVGLPAGNILRANYQLPPNTFLDHAPCSLCLPCFCGYHFSDFKHITDIWLFKNNDKYLSVKLCAMKYNNYRCIFHEIKSEKYVHLFLSYLIMFW